VPRTSAYFAPWALLPEGWQPNIRIEVDETGGIASVTKESDANGAQDLGGPVLPGMPNLHSHAFQRAMAGLGEVAGPSEDSFWTWREVMYRFLAKLTPEQVEAIAAQLYVEMIKGGYTAVSEFHYLHHDRDGSPYGDPAEMAGRILAAAKTSGIGVTLLPVLYGYGGFGGQPTGEGQRRFVNTPDRHLALIERLIGDCQGDPQLRIGLAPHSLRAVTQDSLRTAIEGLDRLDETAPIHIHIAEQTKEVEDCLAWSGQRPVAWLFERQPVGERWCLVHATHMDHAETGALAGSGAVAGLCPTTEANLGDGFFNALAFQSAEGHWGIGSDSNVSVSAIEDLRCLEYGQRLQHRRRNLMVNGSGQHCGAALYRAALAGGAQASGRPLGGLAPGKRADILVLDRHHPALVGRKGDAWLDALVFSGNSNPIRHVMVGGQWLVRDGQHRAETEIAQRFAKTMKELMA